MARWAVFSEDRKYRYELGRTWDDHQTTCVFIGLNPSTADEINDDPTIRRCMGFAKSWGCGSLIMVNLFAYRATNPKELRNVPHRELFDYKNEETLRRWIPTTGPSVAAWGSNGTLWNRGCDVWSQYREHLYYFGVTKAGQPKHPLYLRADTPLIKA